MAQNYRRIATEEAFAIPEQAQGMREIIERSEDYDPDKFVWEWATRGGTLTDRLLDLENERLRIMDQAGVSMHVLSLTSPGVQMLDTDKAVALASIANDRLAEIIKRHPDRFAGLASFAPQDPRRAVKEIERAINTLKLNGLIVNSHTNGEYLDEAKYWPIFEAAEALGVALYIHPRSPHPAMAAAFRKYHLEHAIWGFAADTGLHAVRLIMSGLFDQFPKLKIVLGHMGENIPYSLYRLDWMFDHVRFERPKLRQLPSEYFRQNFLITTSGVNWSPVLQFCISVLGADRIMFAVDYPYQETMEAVRFMDEAPISEEDRAKIFCLNAERVFRIRS